MSILLPELISAEDLEKWFNRDGEGGDDSGGGDNGHHDLAKIPNEDDNEWRPGPEPYCVDHLVGKVALEDTVASLEDRWERGHRLSPAEMHLLGQHEIALDLDYEA